MPALTRPWRPRLLPPARRAAGQDEEARAIALRNKADARDPRRAAPATALAVPLNLLSRWMGHAALETTAIYVNALGAEEEAIAARMWRWARPPARPEERG
jgi:hypothetical protein